jgi:hypothetical protein
MRANRPTPVNSNIHDQAFTFATEPACTALDPHTHLSQHQPNHRIGAAFNARRICASFEQKYHVGQQPKKLKKPKNKQWEEGGIT